MRLDARVTKIEAAIAAKEPKEPIRIIRHFINPQREVVGAGWRTATGFQSIKRMDGESEADFIARADAEFDAAEPRDGRPAIRLTDDDINL